MAASDPYTSAEDKRRLRNPPRNLRRPEANAPPYAAIDEVWDPRVAARRLEYNDFSNVQGSARTSPNFSNVRGAVVPDRRARRTSSEIPEDMMSAQDWYAESVAPTVSRTGRTFARDFREGGAPAVVGRGLTRTGAAINARVAPAVMATEDALATFAGGENYARTRRAGLNATAPVAAANDWSNVQSSASQYAPPPEAVPHTLSPEAAARVNPRNAANGLTRIVRMPDGSFTDAPDAQGEERYYDAVGQRADTSYAGGDDPTGPAQWAQREQAGALDMSALGNQMKVAGRGQRGLSRMTAMGEDVARRAALDEVNQRSPEERAELAKTSLQQAGELTRTQTEAAGRIGAANINAQVQAQSDLAEREAEQLKQFEETERYWAERLNDPATRGAAIAETLDPLVNMPPEAVSQMLADPDDPRGARTRAALRAQLRSATDDPNLNPAQMQRATGLQRFLDGSLFGQAGTFATDDDWFTQTVTGDDIMPGFSDDDFERMLIDPDAMVQRRNRAR